MQFQLYIHAYTCRSLQKLEIGNKKFHLFYKCKGHDAVKYHQTWTKFDLDLRIPIIYPSIKFKLNVCNCCQDNERKINNDGRTE